jgi:hypothetical protein
MAARRAPTSSARAASSTASSSSCNSKTDHG